ncbi:MAG TPA: hypothetical protein VMN78_09895 [Longimicrobiales bacterium]|nr:hypothetical protein [Longimicrobiales bacterium]
MTHEDPHLFPRRREPGSIWERTGVSPRTERRLDALLVALIALFVGGWTWSIAIVIEEDRPPAFASRLTASALSPDAPPPAAFVLDEIVRRVALSADWRGESGALRVRIVEPGDTLVLPDSLPPEVIAELTPAEGDPAGRTTGGDPEPGIWNVVLRAHDAVRPLPGFTYVVPVPITEKRGGRIGRYLLGTWPFEGRAAREGYETPSGLIRVTPENRDLQVSEHFVLGDFLTKGQADVWPKYVVVSPRMLDKLELTIQELERRGHPVANVGIISGFRHPHYNVAGGSPAGRGDLSRHMYGDATDFYIDNDGDGRMDDLNGDGRVDIGDARVMAQAAEQVERDHPTLIGGIGIYRPTGAHSGFIHVDTRGYRARW